MTAGRSSPTASAITSRSWTSNARRARRSGIDRVDLAQHIADVGDGGAAEPGGFDAHSAVDEVEEIRQSAGGHSQVVDAHRGQFGEDRFQRQQQRGIDVELGVPADQIECA
eukprot:gene22362-26820_t